TGLLQRRRQIGGGVPDRVAAPRGFRLERRRRDGRDGEKPRWRGGPAHDRLSEKRRARRERAVAAGSLWRLRRQRWAGILAVAGGLAGTRRRLRGGARPRRGRARRRLASWRLSRRQAQLLARP